MCTIVSQKAARGAPLQINATCPANHGLEPGIWGLLHDTKTGNRVLNSQSRIKTITGNRLVLEAPKLSQPVTGAHLRFTVSTP